MRNTKLKFLLVSIVGSVICVGLARTSNQSVVSKNQRPVEPVQPLSKPVETIEGFNVVRTEGSITAPRSLTEMVDKSDLIVIGRPTQSVVESTALVKRDSEGYINEAISQTEFQVSRVLKGNFNLKKILVGQQAAIVKDKGDKAYAMLVFDDYQPLVKNSKYILFLRKGQNGSPLYFPSGVYFGQINVDGSDQGAKKATFGQEVRAIQADALSRYQADINQSN
jgi:hypothetical protein